MDHNFKSKMTSEGYYSAFYIINNFPNSTWFIAAFGEIHVVVRFSQYCNKLMLDFVSKASV